MSWTRFWRLFKRNIDPFFTIVACFIVSLLIATNIFGSNLNIALSLMLVIFASLALSTIRDR